MTFIPTFDGEQKSRPRLPRELDPVEIRILGSLIEKQLTTPEYYPLTLNALVAACNQKSNRDPVMELGESELEQALSRLQDERLVWKQLGGRAVRYDHNLDRVWHLDRPQKALLALLFLRGAQTAGELRGRSERMHAFASVPEAEELLQEMSEHSEPLLRKLARRPGQKEERWMHNVGGISDDLVGAVPERVVAEPRGEPLSVRIERLEAQYAELAAELRELKLKLGE